MDDHEISAVVFKQLYAIKELGPGRNPTALDQARGTLAAWSEHADPHVRQTAGEALLCFETWFSARKWNRGNDAGQFTQCTLVKALENLCNAIESMAHRQS